ncbi:hypothetical protein [Chryseobacterium sp. M5A1_1a]
MKLNSKLTLVLITGLTYFSASGQKKYCDLLRKEVPRFWALVEMESRAEFLKDYKKISKCVEVDSIISSYMLSYDIVETYAYDIQKSENRLFTYGDWIDLVIKSKKSPQYSVIKELKILFSHKINIADWEKIKKLMKKNLLPDQLEKLKTDQAEKKLFAPENEGKTFMDVLSKIH